MGVMASNTSMLFIIFMLSTSANGLTDAEVKQDFIKTIIKCMKEVPVPMSEVFMLQTLNTPKKIETKCLLACAYKKIGTFNEKGMYDLEEGYKIAELTKNGDEKRHKNGRKLAETCSKVNEIEVSDGEKGCERAAFLFKCVIENAPKLGFKV